MIVDDVLSVVAEVIDKLLALVPPEQVGPLLDQAAKRRAEAAYQAALAAKFPNDDP